MESESTEVEQEKGRGGVLHIQAASRIEQLPPYLFARINKLTYEKRRSGCDVIDMSMGNPSDPPAQFIIDKLAEAASDTRNHGYAPATGVLSTSVSGSSRTPHLRKYREATSLRKLTTPVAGA